MKLSKRKLKNKLYQLLMLFNAKKGNICALNLNST